MRSVRLFDYIAFDGASWQVVAQDGAELALRNLATNRIRRIPVSELLTDESYLPDSPARLPTFNDVAILESVPQKAADQARSMHRHVVELLEGRPPGMDGDPDIEPRPQYDPSLPLTERINVKAEELTAAGWSISARTLARHVSAYRKEGIAGLIDGRYTRSSHIGGRTHPQIITLLQEEMDKQRLSSTGSRSRVINLVKRKASQQGAKVPSDQTLYRLINRMESSRHPFGNATTRRTQSNRPDRTWGRQAPGQPGELVEIDSTPLDLMVVYPDGTTGRVDLTVALDIATRIPLAAVLRPVATKAVDAAIMLARSLTPLPMQPGWAESVSYTRSILPTGMLPEETEYRSTIAARPLIVPQSITIDRGKVYVSSTFMAACEKLSISVVKAAPYTPTDKPHIERFFAGLNSGFTQYLESYTGPNVVRRGKDPAAEARFSLSEAQNLLDWWLVSIWQNRPHPGLRLPAMPLRDLTPNEMYTALAGVAPQIPVALDQDDYIELLPVEWRTIQDYGINFKGLHYDCPDLHEYRGVPSGLPSPANGKWQVRYDPYRLNAVFVRDHHRGRWITADWTMSRHVLGPFSLDVLNAAKRALGQREVDVAGRDLLAEINRIMTAGAQTTDAEKKAARRNVTALPVVTPPDAPEHVDEDLESDASPRENLPPGARTKRHAKRIDLED